MALGSAFREGVPLRSFCGSTGARGASASLAHRSRGSVAGLYLVPYVGGGEFFSVLAVVAMLKEQSGAIPSSGLEAPGLPEVKLGSGRRGSYQRRDARWWVLVRLGDVPPSSVARWAGVLGPQLSRTLSAMDRALGVV